MKGREGKGSVTTSRAGLVGGHKEVFDVHPGGGSKRLTSDLLDGGGGAA